MDKVTEWILKQLDVLPTPVKLSIALVVLVGVLLGGIFGGEAIKNWAKNIKKLFQKKKVKPDGPLPPLPVQPFKVLKRFDPKSEEDKDCVYNAVISLLEKVENHAKQEECAKKLTLKLFLCLPVLGVMKPGDVEWGKKFSSRVRTLLAGGKVDIRYYYLNLKNSDTFLNALAEHYSGKLAKDKEEIFNIIKHEISNVSTQLNTDKKSSTGIGTTLLREVPFQIILTECLKCRAFKEVVLFFAGTEILKAKKEPRGFHIFDPESVDNLSKIFDDHRDIFSEPPDGVGG